MLVHMLGRWFKVCIDQGDNGSSPGGGAGVHEGDAGRSEASASCLHGQYSTDPGLK